MFAAGIGNISNMAIGIELAAPDISAYAAGNTGLDYITTFDSGATRFARFVSDTGEPEEAMGILKSIYERFT
jgi:hypothetical protein